MADQKISQLPTITGANMADNDKFVLVDTSGDATVATTRAEFFNSVPNVTFGDNSQARFGNGNDLKIYHNGSHTFIDNTGVGNLYLRVQGDDKDVKIQSDNGSGGLTEYFRADGSLGQAQMYYYGLQKLNTSSVGINVTGKVASDGLEVDLSSSGNVQLTGAVNSNAGLVVRDPTSTAYGAHFSYDDANTVVSIGGQTNGTKNTAISIGRDSNEINFYEDTGNTAKFFWNSSAESLGIGTSPTSALHVINSNSTGESIATFEASSAKNGYVYINGDANRRKSLVFQSAGVDKFSMGVGDSDELSESSFFIGNGKTGGSGAKLVIDSSGNVGIGIAAPDTILHGAKNGGATLTLENTDTTIGANNLIGGIDFKGNDDSEDGNEVLAYIRAKALDATPDAYLSFGTLGNAGGVDDTVTERMRIAASGNVGISQTGPTALLHVGDSSNSLGGTAGNSLSNLILQSDTSNTDSLIFTTERNSTGTTWTSAAHKIQRKVDAIEMGYMQFGNNTTDLITFGKADTEFVRIDSSGNVSIGKNNVLISAVGVHFTTEGTVSATKDGSIPLVLNRVATGTNNPNGVIAQFRRETVIVGNISVSDGATAYNTSSDYRLKENVVELTSASERVNQLKPSRFNWISDDTNTVIDGFIAHEVATVVPEAITGAKDAMIDEEYEVTPEVLDEDGNVTTEAVVGTRSVPDYQGIDQSKLVPLLTAALQEALTEISSLKSRVEALEG